MQENGSFSFSRFVLSKSSIYKCRNLITEIDMKPPLVLFDVAMSKLLNDIKNTISVRCANMTLFAWTVTYGVVQMWMSLIRSIKVPSGGGGRVPSSLALNMLGYSNLSFYKVALYMISHFTVVLQLGQCSTTASAE